MIIHVEGILSALLKQSATLVTVFKDIDLNRISIIVQVCIGLEYNVMYKHLLGINTVDIDECELFPQTCSQFSVCANTIGSFECTCIHGYRRDGAKCIIDSKSDYSIYLLICISYIIT